MTTPASAARPVPEGDVVLEGRIMPASNATFLGRIESATGPVQIVYKPVAGERPLWDFPDGTLAGREVAAYLVSEALGWDVVPPTWLADGPHGVGMVQEWRDVDPEQSAVAVVRPTEVPPGYLAVFDGVDAEDEQVVLVHEDTAPLRRMAVFDVITNNADRKGGHILEMADGHRHGVDHGLTFHREHKLRTVLWGWEEQVLDAEEVDGVRRVLRALGDGLGDALAPHLTDVEIVVLGRRCERLLEKGRFPSPQGQWPVIPWPPF